jgi:hypothetical protein
MRKEAKMTESEIRDYVWQSSVKHVIAMIEDYSAAWTPTGPSKTTANAILSKIRAMPVPSPTGGCE